MNLMRRIREAKQAHQALRAEPATARNLAEKATIFKPLKALLDELWVATQTLPAQDRSVKALHTAIRHLIIDAEYFAGQNDAEGFRDPSEVWAQYALLERAFATSAAAEE
jgi:hypothetical protein